MRAWEWDKLGLLLGPQPDIWWMAGGTLASFVRPTGDSTAELWVTGRSAENVSRIGVAHLDFDETVMVREIESEPRFDIGEICTFDENGVAYPWLVEHGDALYMYYVGWVPGTDRTPFRNATGLAKSTDGGLSWKRVSRAPILPATDQEPCGTGSCGVMIENGQWRMWYTTFVNWDRNDGKYTHYYMIRHATSEDGVHWQRDMHRCIDFADAGEYAISRPSVIRHDGRYHMWFVYRGEAYRIGYAMSDDGIHWDRRDELAGLPASSEPGWDSEAVCYPQVFDLGGQRYMLYCGNEYGRGGLGLARCTSTPCDLRTPQSEL